MDGLIIRHGTTTCYECSGFAIFTKWILTVLLSRSQMEAIEQSWKSAIIAAMQEVDALQFSIPAFVLYYTYWV